MPPLINLEQNKLHRCWSHWEVLPQHSFYLHLLMERVVGLQFRIIG